MTTMNFHLQGPNIINSNTWQEDIEYLFGDLQGNNEPVIRMDVDCLDWAEIAVHCGFFPSKGQARKNGWEGKVPRGFGQRKFGKQGKGIWYYNPISAEEEMNNQALARMDEQTKKMIDFYVIQSIMNYRDGRFEE
jgi:hypothetical protein